MIKSTTIYDILEYMKLARTGKDIRQTTSNVTWWVMLYSALFFVTTAVLQLFAFEHFPTIIANYRIPVLSPDFSLLVAMIVVVLEVLAIPRLLNMRTSPTIYFASSLAGWLVLVFWLAVGLWQSTADFVIENAGLFGSKVYLPQGWWLVTYMVILLTLLSYIEVTSRKIRPIGYKKRK